MAIPAMARCARRWRRWTRRPASGFSPPSIRSRRRKPPEGGGLREENVNQPEQEPREGEPLKLRERAYASFTERLLAREIKPGQFVTQRELVAMTGFPLGAIRELVPRLEAEGLIKTVPQRGMQVAHVDLNLIRDAFQFRLFLEREAAAIFATAASDALLARLRAEHETIIALCETAQRAGGLDPALV